MTFPFTRDRFRHVLVQRSGDVCLVERTNQLTRSVHWEVVVLQHESTKVIRGRTVPAHARYPSPGEWGTAGWTYTDLDEAQRRYRNLRESTPQTGGSDAA